MSPENFLNFTIYFTFATLAFSSVLVLIRMFRGPSLCNRVVAYDLMSTLMVGAMGLYIILTDQSVLIIVAVLVALIAFLSTVGYAYYVERENQ